MLQYFRKHQRKFFIVITVVVIISFSFFGTFSLLQDYTHAPNDKVYATAFDGSKLMESDVKQMSYFLSSDQGMEGGNLLNDGVIRKDFIETKFAHSIFANYFKTLQPQLSQIFEKMRRFQPYEHPNAPFLSASLLWERFHPKINENMKLVKQKTSFGAEEFNLLSDLYLQQYEFPASALKRWVLFQLKQNPQIPFDQRLYNDDLTLFGFHTAADWFSQEFVDIASQFILNGAILAEKEGYKITDEEARLNLWENFHSYVLNAFPQEKITEDSLSSIYQRQHAALGLDERRGVSLWKKVLLFRKLIEGRAGGINLDPLLSQEVAASKYTVDAIYLPKPLQLKNLRDLFLFSTYLQKVFPARENLLDLPKEPMSIEKIKKEAPSLVTKKYRVEMAQVSKEEVGLRVKVKELWNWQLEDKNWETLKKEFPSLQSKQDGQTRFQKLTALDPNERAKIDAFSLAQILSAHPEWISEELAKKKPLNKEITRVSLLKHPPQGIQSVESFISFLENLPLNKEETYTQDEKVYSRVILKEKGEEEVLSFSEAIAYNVLQEMLDAQLEQEYPKVRSRAPKLFKTKEGEWKPWESVKEEIGTLVFSDLMKAVEKDAAQKAYALTPDKYPFYFFCSYLNSSKNNSSLFLAPGENAFSSQFKLIKREKTLSQRELEGYPLLSAQEGDWLLPKDFNQAPTLIHIMKKEQDSSFSTLPEGALLNETKKAAMEQLLTEWKMANRDL